MKWRDRLLSVKLIGISLLAIAMIITIVGFLNLHYNLPLTRPVEFLVADFYANISAELIGIVITVLIIDQLYERSRIRQLKERLIRLMGSTDNTLVRIAVGELRARGWLEDGTLCTNSFYQSNLSGAMLSSANLQQGDFTQANLANSDFKWSNFSNACLTYAFLENSMLIGANLSGADLGGAYLIETDLKDADLTGAILTCACLWGANLQGARVTDAQLQQAMMLKAAIMPDGHVYNGRFNLEGDIALEHVAGTIDDIEAEKKDKLPKAIRNNEVHTRQFLRWEWAENFAEKIGC